MDIQHKLQTNIPLAPYTTFHIGGSADLFCKAESTEEIVQFVQYAQGKAIPFFILGQGANILVGDKGFRGLVIKNEAKKIRVKGKAVSVKENKDQNLYSLPFALHPEDGVFITAESGVTIQDLITYTSELSLSGLEHYAGIPSSLGGALWQNLHFLSPDRTKTVFIADIVKNAEILSFQNTQESGNSDYLKNRQSGLQSFPSIQKTVGRDYFKFDYDYSILHDSQDVVLSATLCLQKDNKERIIQTIRENLAWRDAKHPKEAWKKSAGSVFKKIPTGAKALAGKEGGAGRFIEQVGLKGKQIGGAQISEAHANFIINTGNASAKDVRALIILAQEKVKEETGLQLVPEISFVGEF